MAGGMLIGSLRVALGLDSAQFQAGARAAQSRMQALGRSMRGISVGMAAAGVGLALAMKGQLNAADAAGEMAQQIGISVEDLTRLRHVAKMSGTSVSGMETGVRQLARAMAAGSPAIKGLGVEVRDANGELRPTVDVMEDIAAKFAAMPDGAEKTARAMKIFGKGGAEMIPILNQGKTGMQALMAEADRLGITISQETSDAASNFNDNLTRLKGTMGGLLNVIVASLAPTLEKLSDWAVRAAAGFQNLSEPVKKIAAGMGLLLIAAFPLGLSLGVLAPLARAAAVAFGLLTGAIKLMSAAILAHPFVALGVAAVAAAVWIWYNWDWLKEQFAALWVDIKTKASEAWAVVKQAGADALDWITGKVDIFVTAIKDAIKWVTDLATKFKSFLDLEEEVSRLDMSGPMFGNRPAAPSTAPGGGVGGGGGGLAAGQSMGIQLVNGMVIGAAQGVARWQGVLSETFGRVTQIARDVLGIASPSTVFRRIGLWIMEGLGFGIRDGEAGPVAAMKGATDKIADGVDGLKSRMEEFKGAAESAFTSFVTGTQTVRQSLSQLAASMAQMFAKRAFSGIWGALFPGFAKGAAFNAGRVTAFAKGGVVAGATAFAMSGGIGVMGEAGPEAIMPLTRGSDGSLGVRAQGGGALSVTIGFDESAGSLTAWVRDEAGRVVAQATPKIVRQAVGATYAASRENRFS